MYVRMVMQQQLLSNNPSTNGKAPESSSALRYLWRHTHTWWLREFLSRLTHTLHMHMVHDKTRTDNNMRLWWMCLHSNKAHIEIPLWRWHCFALPSSKQIWKKRLVFRLTWNINNNNNTFTRLCCCVSMVLTAKGKGYMCISNHKWFWFNAYSGCFTLDELKVMHTF